MINVQFYKFVCNQFLYNLKIISSINVTVHRLCPYFIVHQVHAIRSAGKIFKAKSMDFYTNIHWNRPFGKMLNLLINNIPNNFTIIFYIYTDLFFHTIMQVSPFKIHIKPISVPIISHICTLSASLYPRYGNPGGRWPPNTCSPSHKCIKFIGNTKTLHFYWMEIP